MANLIIQQITSELESLHQELSQFKSTVEYLNAAKSTVVSANESVGAAQSLFERKAYELNSTYDSLVKISETFDSFITKIESIDFPERLDKIELGFLETVEIIQNLKDELNKNAGTVFEQIKSIDFNTKFNDLRGDINKTIKSNQEVIQSVKDQKLPEKIDAFEKNVTKYIHDLNATQSAETKRIAIDTAKTITNMNIPLRLEKLDANFTVVQSSIQKLYNKLETIEKNLIERIKASNDKTSAQITDFNGKISSQLHSISEASLKNAKRQSAYSYITWGFLVVVLGLTSYLTYQHLFN